MEINRGKVGIFSTKLFVILLALVLIGNIIYFIGLAKYMDYIDAKYNYNEEVQEPKDALVLMCIGAAIAIPVVLYVLYANLSHGIKRFLNKRKQDNS